jgi:cell division protein FtsB
MPPAMAGARPSTVSGNVVRALALGLLLLIAAIQYPLWLGKGGWLRVWQLDRQISAERENSARLAARNQALAAEVQDLKKGYDAIEERARAELGMIKQDEIFFQVLDPRRR